MAASYHARSHRIAIHLSNGSSYWASSEAEYLTASDKHIGPFERGSEVIVCPAKIGSLFSIRSNIVGNFALHFHKIRYASK